MVRSDKGGDAHESLSPRELEVFKLIARGKAVKEIAWYAIRHDLVD